MFSLCVRACFGVKNFQPALMPNRSTKLELITSARMTQNECYAVGLLSNEKILNMETQVHKYKVEEPRKLSSWKEIAKAEIKRWLTDEGYEKEVTESTMKNEFMGPFTKFLYHFAYLCECGWGVMIDFDERKQRVFLPDHYYKWMHKLRDEVVSELEAS